MKIFFLIVSGILTSGCGVLIPSIKSESKIQKLNIGDSRQTVINKIGYPDMFESPGIDTYLLYPKDAPLNNVALGLASLTITWWMPSFFIHQNQYWLFYKDNRLSNWTRAGN